MKARRFQDKSKAVGGKPGSTSVASYKRFGKNLLRHCPDTRGNFLWVVRDGPQTEQSLLSLKHIAA